MGTTVRRPARNRPTARNELVSKVTAKAQTTLPSGVRKALATTAAARERAGGLRSRGRGERARN
jgi:hypothetical protein